MNTFPTYNFCNDTYGNVEIGTQQNDPNLNVKLAERDLWDSFDKVKFNLFLLCDNLKFRSEQK